MHFASWFVVVVASAFPCADAPVRAEATEEAVKEQVRRLEPTNETATRLDALKWLNVHSRDKNAGLAIPALERCIHEDPESTVRAEAVLDLGLIAKDLQMPCPLVLVEALLDKEDAVRYQAESCTALFTKFAPGSVDVLLRCSRSENPSLRGDSLLILARAAGKDPKVLEVIEKGKQDKTFEVRHSAYCAAFKANDNLDEFLTYLIRVREHPASVLSPEPADSETGRQERTMRNLLLLGSSMQMIEWSDKRPEEMAAVLVKLLDDKSPVFRRGAANLIGAAVVKTDLPDFSKPGDHFPPLLPYLAVGELPEDLKMGLEPQERPEKSRVAVQLEKLKVADRLRQLRDDDPDRTVRTSARYALERLAHVQEKKP
jgi:HEAT repeat protein